MRPEIRWLGVSREEIRRVGLMEGEGNNTFAYYRLSFELEEAASLTMELSANSRYRLWVNGESIVSGPCRSGLARRYYEAVDVSDKLRIGANVLAVQVLLSDRSYTTASLGDPEMPMVSIAGPEGNHRLILDGALKTADGRILMDVSTGFAPWKVRLDKENRLHKLSQVGDNLGAVAEIIDYGKTPAHWREPGYDDGDWDEGKLYEPIYTGWEVAGILSRYTLAPRPIPLPFHRVHDFMKALGEPEEPKWPLVVAPNDRRELILDMGEHLNAYPIYRVSGGRGAELRFTYFEKFMDPRKGEDIPDLVRDDYVHGIIGENGLTDAIYPDGTELRYEPFWYRTLRFLRIEIQAGEEAVTLQRPVMMQTGYPLDPESYIKADEPWVEELYSVCVRTLQNCMMDAYMDCPFWEQMQYPMDTRLQALFTYACSRDTKLARKALSDFHDSMHPTGLIGGRAPSDPPQIISTFSLHYIFMIWEYYLRTGDASVLKRYRADVDQILEHYDRKIGDDGLVVDLDYWVFVDWQPNWSDSAGVPKACKEGPSTIVNLMYARGLDIASRISERSGRPGLAEEYRQRQQAILRQVDALMWDPARQLYREGPNYKEYTQHAQSWAILNGLKTGEEAAALLRRTFEEEDVLRCYFSTCNELFRACEISGVYALTRQQMDWWIRLLAEHCTTCPETPYHARSECHAWSAQPMYEMIHVLAGIRRSEEDPHRLVIDPHFAEYGLHHLEGRFIMEEGPVDLMLDMDTEGRIEASFHLPEGVWGTYVPGAKALEPGNNRIHRE